jgi:uncharacterized protein
LKGLIIIFNTIYTRDNYLEFQDIIKDIECDETVKLMNSFKQHYNTTCYEHCLNVAFYSYLVCKKCNLDFVSAARAGMLHDLFLYDWRLPREDKKGFHGFRHPKVALNNASKLFDLSNKEKDIITKHMWPITIILPKYKESYIVSCVDKYCAIKESISYYKKTFKFQRLCKYAYIFLIMIFLIHS